MPLSRSFKETVKQRVEEDAAFRAALLAEGIDALLSGEVDIGKSMLRDYINAAVGFARLADETGIPVKSLMRMFGPAGNPSARNLFSVLGALQRSSGASLQVRPRLKAAKSKAQGLRKVG
jgi:DNA-binding phage protein